MSGIDATPALRPTPSFGFAALGFVAVSLIGLSLRPGGPAVLIDGHVHALSTLQPFYDQVLAGRMVTTPVMLPATPTDAQPGDGAACPLEPGSRMRLIALADDGDAEFAYESSGGDCPALGTLHFPGDGHGFNERAGELALFLQNEAIASKPGVPPGDIIATGFGD